MILSMDVPVQSKWLGCIFLPPSSLVSPSSEKMFLSEAMLPTHCCPGSRNNFIAGIFRSLVQEVVPCNYSCKKLSSLNFFITLLN